MKTVERAYPWLLTAPALLPIVVWGGLIYPYLVSKTLLFYTLSLFSLAAFVLLATHGRAFYWTRLARRETWIPAALLVLAYGTSLAGLDLYRSFWSIFARGDGLLMLASVVADFYLILIYVDRAFFERLLRIVAVVGSFVALYGIGEWMTGGGRIGGLIGNAAFFAGYLDITFFATLAAARALSPGWRRVAFIGAVLQVIAIILTATRGTILALGVAGFLYLAYLAFKKGHPFLKRVPLWILAGLIILAGLLFAFRSEIAKVPFAPLARIASVSTSEADVASRLFIWKNMVGQIQQSPWVGVGAEHIDVLFNRFYDPTQITEQWFDRSHNAFLDYAAQYGIGGLLLYLALIATFFTAAARCLRRGDSSLGISMMLLATSYAIQNFFVFDTISSFWLLLALLAILLAASLDAENETRAVSAAMRRASWPVAAALVLLIIPFSVRPAMAAYDLAHAYLYQLTDVSQETSYLSQGFALGTYGDLEYGYEAYDMYANNQAAVLTGQARADAYQAALSILTTDFNNYAYDARTALYLANVLSLAPPGVAIDRDLLSRALERAIRLSPKRSQPWYILVNLSISDANTHAPGSPERIAGYTAARDLLTRYLALVPTLSEPHFVLAQLLYASGLTKEAESEATKGKVYYVGDLETARRAAGYYEVVFDLPDAAFFLAEVVRLDPADTAAANDLAKIQSYL